MKQKISKVIAFVMVFTMLFGGIDATAYAKTIKLSLKTITVTKGTKKTVKIKNIKSKNIKKITVKSSNKKIATVKKSGKTKVIIYGKKAGKANITIKLKVKVNKKKTTNKILRLKVVVKNKKIIVPETKPQATTVEQPITVKPVETTQTPTVPQTTEVVTQPTTQTPTETTTTEMQTTETVTEPIVEPTTEKPTTSVIETTTEEPTTIEEPTEEPTEAPTTGAAPIETTKPVETTTGQVPPPVKNICLSGINMSNQVINKFTLMWDSVKGEDIVYNVYVKNNKYQQSPLILVACVENTDDVVCELDMTYTLTRAGSYSVYVAAQNNAGESEKAEWTGDIVYNADCSIKDTPDVNLSDVYWEDTSCFVYKINADTNILTWGGANGYADEFTEKSYSIYVYGVCIGTTLNNYYTIPEYLLKNCQEIKLCVTVNYISEYSVFYQDFPGEKIVQITKSTTE